jgi:nucleoside-diphosphate-sugar epimerase
MYAKFPHPILVTGATGMVGSRFVPRLIAAGEEVRALVRDPESAAALAIRAAGAELAVGDLTTLDDAGFKAALEGTSAVVHLAAAFRKGETGAEAFAANTDASVALANAALDAGVQRYVFASTNLVYGPGHADAQSETTEPHPLDWPTAYPETKLAAERALSDLHAARGLDLRVVRLAFVYGDGDPHIAQFLERPLDGWHSAKRLQMVHHADVAQGLILALRAENVAGEVFNIADDSPVTLSEVLRLAGRPVPAELADQPLDDPWFGVVDTLKARRYLGFRPFYPTLRQAMDAGTL